MTLVLKLKTCLGEFNQKVTTYASALETLTKSEIILKKDVTNLVVKSKKAETELKKHCIIIRGVDEGVNDPREIVEALFKEMNFKGGIPYITKPRHIELVRREKIKNIDGP